MNISINSPAYYTQQFGVIDEIYRLCKSISGNIEVSDYTAVLDIIGITPIVAPDDLCAEGKWKEERRILTSARMAILSLRVDYAAFCESDVSSKKQLILENVFESLEVVKEKLKNDFDIDKMKKDIIAISKKAN